MASEERKEELAVKNDDGTTVVLSGGNLIGVTNGAKMDFEQFKRLSVGIPCLFNPTPPKETARIRGNGYGV